MGGTTRWGFRWGLYGGSTLPLRGPAALRPAHEAVGPAPSPALQNHAPNRPRPHETTTPPF